MEPYTFIVVLITLITTVILGMLNYRIANQVKKLNTIKRDFESILKNTLGFIELELNYSKALADKTEESEVSIKRKFRKELNNKINSDFSGEQKIKNLLEKLDKN